MDLDSSFLIENLELLVVVGFVVLIAFIVLIGIYFDKRRREALSQIALKFGFTFSQSLPEHLYQQFSQLSFFQIGRSQEVYNVLSKQEHFGESHIFDYTRETGSGKNRSTARFTIVLFVNNVKTYPSFTLRPENFLDRIGELAGFKDIDFPEAPEFSKKFLLKGSDESAIRRLFSPHVIRALEQSRNINIEASGNILIFTNWKAKAKDIRGTYEDALKVYQAFA